MSYFQKLKELFSFKKNVPANSGEFWRSQDGVNFLNLQRTLEKQIQIATGSEAGFRQGLPKSKNDQLYAHTYCEVLWVHVAVKAIAETAAMIPFKVYDQRNRSDGTIELQEVSDSFATQVLKNPSIQETSFELQMATHGSYGYDGNAFVYVDPDNVEMWGLRPQDVRLIASKSTLVDGYVFRRSDVGAEEQFIAPERMVHIKSFNPKSYFYGLSPLSAAWSEINYMEFDSNYWNNFFREGGRVMGMWSTDQALADDEYIRMKEEIRGSYKGSRNMFRDIILHGGLKFEQLGVSAKDQDLINKRQLTRQEILAVYGVPPSIAGILEFANYSNMEVQERIFYQRAILPQVTLLAEAYSHNPILSENRRLVIKPDLSEIQVLKENIKSKADVGRVLIESGQWTQNEVRLKFWDKDPIDGGDVLKPLVTQSPFLGLGAPEFQAKALCDHNPKKKEIEPNEVEPPQRVSHYTKEEREQFAKEFSDQVDSVDSGFSKLSAKFFQEIGEKVLSNIRQVLRDSGRDELSDSDLDKLFDGTHEAVEGFAEKLPKEYRDVFEFFMVNEVDRLRGQIGKSLGVSIVLKQDDEPGASDLVLDFTDPNIGAFVQKRTVQMVNTVTNTTSEEIRAVIAGKIKEGATIQEIAQAVRGYIDYADTSRAMTIARTEVASAGNYAKHLTHIQNSEFIEAEEWISARDGNVREDHILLDGFRKPIDGVFSISGASAPYPGGFGVAELDINCRCTTVAVTGRLD